MQPKVIVGIFARVTDGEQIFNYLLTTAPYHDPALESQIVGGTAWPVIQSDATFDIGESIQFQPQGGNSGASIGSVPIDNTGGHFDAWMRYNFASMEWTIKRGYDYQSWAEFELIFEAEGRGRPELNGQEIIVPLRGKFGYMREPVAQEVFDADTTNASLINTTAPMVFGEAYQVGGKLAEPNILAYFGADNLAQVFAVAEGGNPFTPQWVRLPQGFQLTASPSLTVTADIAGPPAINPDIVPDALEGKGRFEDWLAGELDYPDTTVSTTVDASLTEGPDGSTGILDVPASTSFDTGFQSGTQVDIDPGGSGYVREIRSVDLGLSLPGGVIVTGIEIEFTGRWFQINGDYIGPPRTVTSLGVVTPSGLVFSATPASNEIFDTNNSYSVGGQFDLLSATTGLLTSEIVNDPDFAIRVNASLASGQRLIADVLRVKIYYVTEEQYVRILWEDVLDIGARYTLSIETVGADSPEDAVLANWESSVDEQDPQSGRSAMIGGTDIHEYVFTAGQFDFDLYFYRGAGNGAQEINSIILRKGSSARNRYHELIRYLHETAGRDPDLVCDNDSLELVQAQADNPRMGWYVSDQTTREQLSTFFSHSLAAVSWGGIDGKWKAAQMQVPKQPDGEYLAITQAFSEPSAVPDYAEDLRDRAHAAKNFRPITEAEAAGVTTNWSRSQQEQIKAEWRITERADFDNLIDYDGPTP